MNDGCFLLMKINQTFQYFMAPLLDHLQLWVAHLLQILSQTSTCNHFCNEVNLFLFLRNPSIDERDNVWMMQGFYQIDFWFYSRTFCFWKSTKADYTPCHFPSSIMIHSSIHSFISTLSELLIKSLESTLRWDFHELLILFFFLLFFFAAVIFIIVIFILCICFFILFFNGSCIYHLCLFWAILEFLLGDLLYLLILLDLLLILLLLLHLLSWDLLRDHHVFLLDGRELALSLLLWICCVVLWLNYVIFRICLLEDPLINRLKYDCLICVIGIFELVRTHFVDGILGIFYPRVWARGYLGGHLLQLYFGLDFFAESTFIILPLISCFTNSSSLNIAFLIFCGLWFHFPMFQSVNSKIKFR